MCIFLRYVLLLFLFYSTTTAQLENFTFRLSQSDAVYEFWTTVPSERVFKDTEVPAESGSAIRIYMARNEFEPFQLVVKPFSSGSLTITMGDFGSGITTELYQVKYVNITQTSDHLGRTGDYPDALWPLDNGQSIEVTGGENMPFWISIFVPAAAVAGDYSADIQIGGKIIPVSLHVFDFQISDTLHVLSQLNFSYQNVLTKYSVPGFGTEYWMYVDLIKQYFKDHRLTPQAVLWPGGLTTSGGAPLIDYDCAGNLSDPNAEWGFETPAQWYLDGQAMRNNVGFPSFMAATFMNNDASADQRPSIFCGQVRTEGDWYTGDNPNSPYNQEWFAYMNALQDYLGDLNYLDKAYYYIANEPQNQADYDAVAWYSQILKQAAPDLKLMISENPRSEIFDHPTYTGSKIDIWMPVLQEYDPNISHDRELNHGEVSWIYFLPSTRPTFFNPVTLDHPGIESKLCGWFLWKYRIKGIAYYSTNDWSQNPWTDPMLNDQNGERFLFYPPSENNENITYGANNHRLVPSIRLELLRDGFEDYEYLYRLNGNNQPQIGIATIADSQAAKIISGLASYARSSAFLYNLRKVIGQKIAGEISEIPDIRVPATHPRSNGEPGNYYINFQDPDGEPYTTISEDRYGTGYLYKYVTYAGHDYLQAGIEQYADSSGFGWLDDVINFATGRSSGGGETDERKMTFVYDDYAQHPNIFEFDIPNGTYMVEAAVGTPGIVRAHNRLVIEGVTFVDDEASSFTIVRSAEVTVTDSKLTLDVGIVNEYTMLNYVNIEVVSTAIERNSGTAAKKFALHQNYPNPFNATTMIEFTLADPGFAVMKLYNLLGQEVETLVAEKLTAGKHRRFWNAENLTSGVYFYRLQVNDGVIVRKLLLLK